MLFSVVWNIKMCELLNPQRTIKGSQLLQLHNCWIFLQMMPVIYITIPITIIQGIGMQVVPPGMGLWDGISSPLLILILMGREWEEALLAIWAIGKVILHLAFKNQWSVLWTCTKNCTQLCRINVWIYTSTLTTTELILFWGSALSHLRLVLWVGSFCLIFQLLQSAAIPLISI